jgi:hypothetical protein
MSEANLNIVCGMCESFGTGDIYGVISAPDPQLEWREAENFIYEDRNPYLRPQARSTSLTLAMRDFVELKLRDRR